MVLTMTGLYFAAAGPILSYLLEYFWKYWRKRILEHLWLVGQEIDMESWFRSKICPLARDEILS